MAGRERFRVQQLGRRLAFTLAEAAHTMPVENTQPKA